MSPPTRPNSLPCKAIRDDFDTGCSLLLSDTRWRWIKVHWLLADAKKLSKKEVAEAALGMNESYFGKLVSRRHGVSRSKVKHATAEDYRRVRYGLRALGLRVGELPQIGWLDGSHDQAREDRTFQVAGSLIALNRLGAGLTKCHPLGPLHYFCLERMSATKRLVDTEETWFEAEGDPTKMQRVAKNIRRHAEKAVEELDPHVLEDLTKAEEKNRLPDWQAFKTLYDEWVQHWRVVRDCMKDPETVAQSAAHTNRN